MRNQPKRDWADQIIRTLREVNTALDGGCGFLAFIALIAGITLVFLVVSSILGLPK